MFLIERVSCLHRVMAVFDGLCCLTHRSHGLRVFCSYINLGFSGVFAFLPTNTFSLPTPLIFTIMSSSPMTSAPAVSPSSENLTNIKGLSSWELLQNHYQPIGSVHKADYFPSVSFLFLCRWFVFLIGLFFLVFFLGCWFRRYASGFFFR